MNRYRLNVVELLLQAGSDLFHEDAWGRCASSRAPLTQTYFVLTYRKPTHQVRLDDIVEEKQFWCMG